MTLGRAAFAALILQVATHAQTGVLSTIAGRGTRGYDGDGGPAVNAALAFGDIVNQRPCDPAPLEQTSHIAVDAQGNIYFTDSKNNRVRRIDSSGKISTVAGTGEAVSGCESLTAAGDG